MAEFGSPTELAGAFSRVEVDLIGFDNAAAALAELSMYIENAVVPLSAVKKIAQEDIEERFITETEPDGDGWFDLDPDYASRKQHDVGFEHPILTHGGELRKAATESARWTIVGDSLFYSTEGLPEYWRVHQEGSESFGVKFHAGVDTDISKAGSDDFEQNIPPRPFIGLSGEAEAKILEVFDIWFSEGIDMATKRFIVSPSGTLHRRTNLGRIGEKVEF